MPANNYSYQQPSVSVI